MPKPVWASLGGICKWSWSKRRAFSQKHVLAHVLGRVGPQLGCVVAKGDMLVFHIRCSLNDTREMVSLLVALRSSHCGLVLCPLREHLNRSESISGPGTMGPGTVGQDGCTKAEKKKAG